MSRMIRSLRDTPRTSSACGLLLTIAFVMMCGGCDSTKRDALFDSTEAKYVGQATCVACHAEQAKLFSGSHHDLAMQLATDETVLGDFDDATIEHHGIVSRMFRDGEKFMVHTEGADGQMTDFEIKQVFGVEPLQQYMVEFPKPGSELADNELPRVQVLRICWDTQRGEWFYLAPPDVSEKLEPSDDLHWTGIAQRWNNMCAECHSTDYRKHFIPPDKDPHSLAQNDSDISGEYRSTFLEIDVSCEACHGPGSQHVELAKLWFPGWNRERGYGLANLKASAEHQIQACAPCHSRRNVISGGFQAGDEYYDFYTNQLLTEPVYYPDGQILDEDYVHGSFIQSKMYHKGIRCSDCHDPHTARLKHVGNEVCTSCHQHPTAKYDTVAHHRHQPESEGGQCVNCHMPATTYMAVDSRRDHSFRIPRPDLSMQINTPNACTACHLKIENVSESKRDRLKLYQDWMLMAREGDEEVTAELQRANAWCDAACEQWYGENRRREEHFGLAIAAGQTGAPSAKEQLIALLGRRGAEAPYIARATALQVLMQIDPQAAAAEAVKAIDDNHPLVRSTSTSALLGNSSPTQSVSLLEKALSDPIRCVRTEAARNLLEYPQSMWSESSGSAFRRALTELVDGLEYNNDRSGAHMALGILAAMQGRSQQAIKHYETAIAVEPQVAGPRTNLAALLESNADMRGQPLAADAPLTKEINRLRQEELELLARDVELLPDAAAIQYRYGLALYLDGQRIAATRDDLQPAEVEQLDARREEALQHLIRAAELEPSETSFAEAVAMLLESLGRWDQALDWARQAVERSARSPQSLLLLQRIEQAAAAAGKG